MYTILIKHKREVVKQTPLQRDEDGHYEFQKEDGTTEVVATKKWIEQRSQIVEEEYVLFQQTIEDGTFDLRRAIAALNDLPYTKQMGPAEEDTDNVQPGFVGEPDENPSE